MNLNQLLTFHGATEAVRVTKAPKLGASFISPYTKGMVEFYHPPYEEDGIVAYQVFPDPEHQPTFLVEVSDWKGTSHAFFEAEPVRNYILRAWHWRAAMEAVGEHLETTFTHTWEGERPRTWRGRRGEPADIPDQWWAERPVLWGFYNSREGVLAGRNLGHTCPDGCLYATILRLYRPKNYTSSVPTTWDMSP